MLVAGFYRSFLDEFRIDGDVHFVAHHDRCVELFVKADGFGGFRMPRLTHQHEDYPYSLALPAEADVPSPPRPGMPSAEPTASAWLMKSVELVGLLKTDRPGVHPATTGHVRLPPLGRFVRIVSSGDEVGKVAVSNRPPTRKARRATLSS